LEGAQGSKVQRFKSYIIREEVMVSGTTLGVLYRTMAGQGKNTCPRCLTGNDTGSLTSPSG